MKRTLSFSAKIWGFYVVIFLLTLVFTLGISNQVVRMILDTALLAIFAYLSYAEGAYRGERAVSVGETIRVQEKEGRPVLEEQRSQVFSPKYAVVAMLIAALPFLAVSAINAAYYPTYMVEFEAEQAQKAEEEAERARVQAEALAEAQQAAQEIEAEAQQAGEDTGETQSDELLTPEGEIDEAALTDALVAEAEESDVRPRPQHWARLMAWMVFIPFSSFSMVLSDKANMFLFFFYSIFLPAAGLTGYLMGPRLHKNKIKAMKKGSRRKKKRLLVNRQPKQQKPVV